MDRMGPHYPARDQNLSIRSADNLGTRRSELFRMPSKGMQWMKGSENI